MSKRKIIKLAILLLLMIVSNILVFSYANIKDTDITLSYNVVSDKADTYQLFYGDGSDWSEENSQKTNYEDVGNEQKLEFSIPNYTKSIRFDLGGQVATIKASDIKLSYYWKNIYLDYNKLIDENRLVQIASIEEEGNYLNIISSGTDPNISYVLDNDIISTLLNHKMNINITLKVLICIIIDALLFIVLRKSRSVLALVHDLYNSRLLIWSLAKNDFKTKYAGSYLGIIWAFIQPVVTILVYWIVFEFGLRAGSPIANIPFVLWFAIGLVPWFFFSEAVLNATNCLFEYSYLVKKVVFKVSVLPIVKIISAFFVHLVFILFMIFLYILYGLYPTIYIIQLPYYVFCTFFIVLAISYATSAVVLFFKDLGQIINIFLQIGMWMTPIMWSYTIVPEKYQWIVKLNPMYYIVEGYRDTFINKIWFFENYFQTIYFWILILGLFVLGALIFKKLKPHFADML